MSRELVLILDFGSQYTQLIARRIRELSVYSEIHPFNLPIEEIRRRKPIGIVLSGGPSSVYDEGAPAISPELLGLGVPVLGICYGAQLVAKLLGGRVAPSDKREYGRAHVFVKEPAGLFDGFAPGEEITVWMSHGDRVEELPPGFALSGETPNAPAAAFADRARNIHCVQFHPEVAHTPRGEEILSNFLFRICGAQPSWTMHSFVDQAIADVRAKVGARGKIICALSGGVDSSVVAALLHRAVGEQLTCIFVDNGLCRLGERENVAKIFRDHFRADLRVVDAEARFLERLAGVTDPERKRKIIGNEFIAIFEEEARKVGGAEWLAQGTLYPDVIESVSIKGPIALIKSHHNLGGLPERMNLKLVEPLRELFKDEVRRLGEECGLPRHMVWRQPFPGPGLAVRCLGEITKERLDRLRLADAIIEEEIRAAGLYESIWQAFAVLLPVRSVGVMGDARTYDDAIAVRCVTTDDFMTADWTHLPYEVLASISTRIINEVKGVNRVAYDISSKPPATIEWE